MSLPIWARALVAPETQFLELDAPFELESGEHLGQLQIAFRTWGDIANAKDNAILVCHALTGSADVDKWWPGIIGKGAAFDPDKDFIVCANILGSCYGSSGPASINPGTGEAYRADFPQVSVRDMVNAQARLLDHLGVEQIDVVTGPSLGGMQALEWAAMYPQRVNTVVPIGVGGQHSAWCIAISEAQRAAIAADANWCDGYYTEDARPEKGLSAARMMAICTYRSATSFAARFGREQNADGLFEAQSYLNHQGRRINERFDANCYVTLTHAMHSHDLARGRGDYTQVLAGIEQPALVVSVSTDALYPPAEQLALATALPNARYEILESAHGHDGFLIETDTLGGLIRAFRDARAWHSPLRLASSAGE